MIRLKKVLLLLFVLQSGYLLATDNSQAVKKILCQLSLSNRTLEKEISVANNRRALNDSCRNAFGLEDDEETFYFDDDDDDDDDDDGEKVYTIFFKNIAVEEAYLARVEIIRFLSEEEKQELENDQLVEAELGAGRTFTACAGPETNDDSD